MSKQEEIVVDAKERRERQQREVDANYEAFRGRLPELFRDHAGKIALMKDRKIVEFFDSDDDAWKTGRLMFGGDVFSIQPVDNRPVQLGWMGYALFHCKH